VTAAAAIKEEAEEEEEEEEEEEGAGWVILCPQWIEQLAIKVFRPFFMPSPPLTTLSVLCRRRRCRLDRV
jgi:hypothetical protein